MPPNEMESVWPPWAEPWSETTPGARSARSRKSRLLRGSEEICLVSTSVRTAWAVVSTSGADAETVTLSCTPAICSVSGISTCDAMFTRTSVRFRFSNPVRATLSV